MMGFVVGSLSATGLLFCGAGLQCSNAFEEPLGTGSMTKPHAPHDIQGKGIRISSWVRDHAGRNRFTHTSLNSLRARAVEHIQLLAPNTESHHIEGL